MGLLIGDGSFRNTVNFTSVDKQLIQALDNYIESPYRLRKDKITYTINRKQGRGSSKPNKYREIIKHYGLWNMTSHDKFVPPEFLYNSTENRWALLQGLMDTDGEVNKKGNCAYNTTSQQLATDVKNLVQSLGGLAVIKDKVTKCNDKIFNSFKVRISFNDNKQCFRLKRKIKRCHIRTKKPLSRTIRNITKIGKKPCQCIKVADRRGLYLTNHYVVTHNTAFGDNIGLHIADKVNIPVLNLDTEMLHEDHIHRLLAMMTKTHIDEIETGKFATKADIKTKIGNAAKRLTEIPYYHKSIAGRPLEDIVAIMRRWVTKEVGLNNDGTVKDCVILYDYLKLMNSAEISDGLKEYQIFGFMLTTLHNFAHRYKIPILAFIQLNRDGITRETTDVISQSDRIGWLCSSFTIFKTKDDEEIAEDGVQAGNRKLVPVVARHGPCLEWGDYINCTMTGWCSKIEEGETKLALKNKSNQEGFIVDDHDDEQDIPFE
jgi:replicative DNA helicase